MSIYGKKSLLAFVIGALACASLAWADPPDRVGRLNLIIGPVTFNPGGVEQWTPAVVNYPLTIGDALWTDRGGRAEIHVGSTAIRLDSDTDFSFLNLDDQIVQARLSQGAVSIRVRELYAGDAFEIDTPNASVSLLAPGFYRINVRDNGDTDVIVRSGESQVGTGGSSFTMESGQAAMVSRLESPVIYLMSVPREDDWDVWCLARDRDEDTVVSVLYVPRSLIGCEDLDRYGSWRVTVELGPVWTPRNVHSGWAPYRDGHWAWVDPWGWTWIDDAPWGFAPFHYGRWAWFEGGWVWVPGTIVARPVYAPALVVFVGGGAWSPSVKVGAGIGWFPLGPNEAYVPPFRASDAYVRQLNVGHVKGFNPQDYKAGNVAYINRKIPQAVTVVPGQVFIDSRPVAGAAVSVSEADLQKAPVHGMFAPMTPKRESVMAQQSPVKATVAHPPAETASRPVVARLAPPPAPVPFVEQEKAIAANKGRPLDSTELQTLQKGASAERSMVKVLPQSTNQVGGKSAGGEVAPQSKVIPQTNNQQGTVVTPQPSDRTLGMAPRENAGAGDRSQAVALIGSVKGYLSSTQQRASAAMKERGSKINSGAVNQRLVAARNLLAGADGDVAAGNNASAIQKANAARAELDQVESMIAGASQAQDQPKGLPPQQGPQESKKR